MPKDPAFLFYSNDFEIKTKFFTHEQVGKYIRLLLTQHQFGHLSQKQIIHVISEWDNEVISKFSVDKEGLYFNERLEKVLMSRRAYSESRRNNAKHRYDSSSSKSKDMPKNKDAHDTAYAPAMQVHMGNENENENEDKDGTGNKGVVKVKKTRLDCAEPIRYLNEKAGKKFSIHSEAHLKFVRARFAEGKTLEDFKAVIDKKIIDWLGNENERYLRPETLFNATKFEGYLNQPTRKNKDSTIRTMEDTKATHDQIMEQLK